jgi:hypothetical protein
MVAGGVGGTAAKSLLAPVQRIVVLQQLGEHRQMRSFDLAKMIVKKEGITGFWRGNLTSIMIRFPYSGSQFVIYSKVKYFLQSLLGYDGSERLDESRNSLAVNVNKFMMKCGAGGISASLAGILVYPGEVVRLRLMSGEERFTKIIPTIGHIWRETNSPRNFYRGLGASLAQRVPDIVINFSVYETVKFELISRGFNEVLSMIAGASLAGLASIAIAYPLDVAKRRIGMSGQGKSGIVYYSVAHCLREVWKEQGLRGWYRGSVLEAARIVPQVVLMWLFIEETQAILSQLFETSRKQQGGGIVE